MWHRCPYRLRSGFRQAALRNPQQVDQIKELMLKGKWDFKDRGHALAYWRDGRTVWIGDGHHRVNAALEIGRSTGDWSYLDRLLEFGIQSPDLPPKADRCRFPTRGWLSWLLMLMEF